LKLATSVVLAFLQSLILAVGVLAVGTHSYVTITAALFQLTAGHTSAYFCRIQNMASRTQSLYKDIKTAGEQNRSLLFTIVPANVVAKLDSAADYYNMVGALVPHCTVMFCTLEQAAALQAKKPPLIIIGDRTSPTDRG
jgi:hypothetical protein